MHGGDIYRNDVRMDFSVNVNPLGIPDRVKKVLQEAVEESVCYPDIKAEALQDALAGRYGLPPEWFLCGNGASELFLAIVHALRPQKAVLPAPCFSGYEYVLSAADCEISYYNMQKDRQFCLEEGIMRLLCPDVDILFLANPNNPTGSMADGELLEKIVKRCGQNGTVLVLDECFLEFTGKEEASYLTRLDTAGHVIVVRAFTKLYAIPGVRAGYCAVSGQPLRERIRRQLPEWNVSIFAQKAGVAALQETEYVHRTIKEVARQREYLEKEMTGLGIRVYPSAANYMLLFTEVPLYEMLLEHGILIRDCSDYRGLAQGYYRIAVKDFESNKALVEACRKVVGRWNREKL